MIRLLCRALALYQMRCLEIQSDDQTAALHWVADVETFRAICTARERTQRELLAVRRYYTSLLNAGQCPTWRAA